VFYAGSFEAFASSATPAAGGGFINEVKQWGDYETKSFDLHRKLSARADDRRANAKQPGTQKGSAKTERVS
jgi:hypothetical protein